MCVVCVWVVGCVCVCVCGFACGPPHRHSEGTVFENVFRVDRFLGGPRFALKIVFESVFRGSCLFLLGSGGLICVEKLTFF